MSPQVKGARNVIKFDVQACVTNMAKLEKLIQANDAQLERMNMLVQHGYEGNSKTKPKINYKYEVKANDWKVSKVKECVMFTKGVNLEGLMNIAHGVTTIIPSQVRKSVEASNKAKVAKHEPSPSYYIDYMVIMDHNGKIVVKYVGAYTKKAILRSVWVPKVYPSNVKDPNFFAYLNSRLNLFCRPIPPVAPHGCLIVDAQII
jgi:hypothetical protein